MRGNPLFFYRPNTYKTISVDSNTKEKNTAMLKRSVRNYFVSLKYFFTPLGTMFLGMMIGFSILVPGIISATSELIGGVKKLSESVQLDFGILFENMWQSVQALPWDDPEQAIGTLFSAQYLNKMLTQALETILGTDFETFQMQIAELVSVYIVQIIVLIVLFFTFWLLGFIAGNMLTKYLIRRKIAKRSLWKWFIAYLINAILTAALTLLCLYLFLLWHSSIFLSVIASMFLSGIFSLLEAYLLYGYKKIALKTIVNVKNAGLYLLGNLLVILISVCLSLLAFVVNAILGIFAGLTFIGIALAVTGMNAESYVIHFQPEQAPEAEIEPPARAA